MKRILGIILIVLVGAFLLKGVDYLFDGDESAKQEMTALEAIATRTSVRAYTDQPVAPEIVEQILRAGMAAPTAVNKQPWAFVVVDSKETLQQLADSLPYAKMLKTAPLAIVVCGDMSKALEGTGRDYWIQDASAATENILLAAHALGLGAVWTGGYPSMDRVNSVKAVLELPSHIIPLCVIPMGYPAETPTPKDKWKPENVRVNNWNNPYK